MTKVQAEPGPVLAVRVLSVIAALGILGGFTSPLMLATKDGAEAGDHVWLLQAIPGLAEAGGGPYEGEALLASIAVGIAAAALAVGIVMAIVLFRRPSSPRVARVAQIVAVVVLLGCAGLGFLIFILAGLWDARVFPLSPAAGAAAVGSALLLVAGVLARRRAARG